MARREVGVPPKILQEAAEPVLARIRADAARLPPAPLGQLLSFLADNLFTENLSIKDAKHLTGVRGNRVVEVSNRELGCPPRSYLEDCRAEVAESLRERMPELSLERIAEAIGFTSASALAAALKRRRARGA